MQVAGVDCPDYEGPHFFGVPAPVAVPCALSPNRTGDQREAPENETNDVEAVGKSLNFLHAWKQIKNALDGNYKFLLRLLRPLSTLQKVGN